MGGSSSPNGKAGRAATAAKAESDDLKLTDATDNVASQIGHDVERAIPLLVVAGQSGRLRPEDLQRAATTVTIEGSDDRLRPYRRRMVASYVGVYLWRFLPPSPWTLLEAAPPGAWTIDLLWAHPRGSLLADEVKTSPTRARSPLPSRWTSQIERHLRVGLQLHSQNLLGVRMLPLGSPRRALLFATTGRQLLIDTPFCAGSGWVGWREVPVGSAKNG